jgi:hypothetical protein
LAIIEFCDDNSDKCWQNIILVAFTFFMGWAGKAIGEMVLTVFETGVGNVIVDGVIMTEEEATAYKETEGVIQVGENGRPIEDLPEEGDGATVCFKICQMTYNHSSAIDSISEAMMDSTNAPHVQRESPQIWRRIPIIICH